MKHLFFAAVFLLVLSCEDKVNQGNKFPTYKSFRDIPGVTENEIAAIEALQKKNTPFVYGMMPTAEAFLAAENSGEVKGFSALFCQWLTDLFQINFQPSLYAWSDLIAGLEQDIHFTGDLMATKERQKAYFMTDAIAERSLSIFRMADAPPLPLLTASRPLRFAFLNNSVAFVSISEVVKTPFEPIFVNDFSAAYDVLASGEADAFFSAGITEASFSTHEDVVNETFFPLIHSSVSLSTQNPELAPIINVVQKALQHSNTRHYLANIYQAGNDEYRQHKFFSQLSAEELAYIENNIAVKFAAEIDNYPISFYNIHERAWQGVAHEVLAEVEKLTGLRFEITNSPDSSWVAVLGMLERGEVAMLSELVRTDEREGHFLWPETAIMKDRAVLLSRIDHPNIALNKLMNVRIGVVKNSAYAELFRHWFPNHPNVKEYSGMGHLLEALENDNIQMIMGRTNQFLNLVNYREVLDYKINVVFDSYFNSFFGLHKDEIVLRSLLDKSLRMIDTESISINWAHKAHDYRAKVMEARLPWLIGAIIFSLITLTLILIMFRRNRSEGKRLEVLVKKRTAEIEKQRKLLEYMSLTDSLTGLPNRRNFDMQLDIEWQIAIREKQTISFLMLDIDHFKNYNDMYGHQQGDEVLRIISKIIEQTPKRPGDFVARWGGEEFVVLLSNTGTKGAFKIAEAIRANVEKTDVFVNGFATKLTVSIGVNTQSPEQGSSLESFISIADKEMYKAKEAGRNRVCCFPTHPAMSKFSIFIA
jgi:diguanylate cyclase (GGDEF)-like protein